MMQTLLFSSTICKLTPGKLLLLPHINVLYDTASHHKLQYDIIKAGGMRKMKGNLNGNVVMVTY